MINTVLVDDQEIVREGLKMILSLHSEINILGEASNGEELLGLLKEKIPDVILMDIRMPGMDGIEATKAVKKQYPGVKIIMLTTFYEDEYIFDCLKHGADGYILKDSSSKEIIASIKAACDGNMVLNPKVTSRVVNALNSLGNAPGLTDERRRELLGALTPRETEVVEQLMQGKSNKAISEALFVTEGTVKNYVSHILEKLELESRAELILLLQGRRA